MAARSLLLLAALACALSGAAAYPAIWTAMTKDCAATPMKSYGPHTGPVPDLSTALTVTKNGGAVKRVCPGVVHRVKAKFEDKRQYIFTASQGALGGATDTSCPNRAISSTPANVMETDLMVACDATGDVALQLLSVEDKSGNRVYQVASATLPVLDLGSCPNSACHALMAQAYSQQQAELDAAIAQQQALIAQQEQQQQQQQGAGAAAGKQQQQPAIITAMPINVNLESGTLNAAAANTSDKKAATNALMSALGQAFPKPQMPKFEMPKFEMPKFETPKLPVALGAIADNKDGKGLTRLMEQVGSLMTGAEPGAKIDAATVLGAVKHLSSLLPSNATSGLLGSNPELANMLKMVQGVSKFIPASSGGGAAAAGGGGGGGLLGALAGGSPKDVPSAVLACLRSARKLMPQDGASNPSLPDMVSFVKSVSDLMTVVRAAQGAGAGR